MSAAGWRQARIAGIRQLTPRISAFRLDAELDRPVAGQHLQVRLTAPDGYTAQRDYSIASPPEAAEVELMVEQLADGEVSGWFHEAAAVGDALEVKGPQGGHFVWRAADGGPLLLVGGGSGIAPLLAIARHRALMAAEVPTLLIHSARTTQELACLDELLAMEGQSFTLIAVTTRGPAPRPLDLDRRLDASALHDILARWGRAPRHSFVCGSNGFVEAVTGALVRDGIPAGTIRAERYGGAP